MKITKKTVRFQFCTSCRTNKPITEFYKRKQCKTCISKKAISTGIWQHLYATISPESISEPNAFLANFALIDKRIWKQHIAYLNQKKNAATQIQIQYEDIITFFEKYGKKLPLFICKKQCKICGKFLSHYWGETSPTYQIEALKCKNYKGLFFGKCFDRNYSVLNGTASSCIFCKYKLTKNLPKQNFHPESILELRNFSIIRSDSDEYEIFNKEYNDFLILCEQNNFPVNLLTRM